MNAASVSRILCICLCLSLFLIHCGVPDDKKSCTQQKMCKGTVLQKCSVDAAGKRIWSQEKDCASDGKECKASGTTASCVSKGCTSSCSTGQAVRCQGDTIQKCIPQANGCLAWSTQKECAKEQKECTYKDGQVSCTEPKKFAIRKPLTRSIQCDGAQPGKVQFKDVDTMCSIQVGGLNTQLYIQSTPTSCKASLFSLPIYGQTRGWIKEGEKWLRVTAKFDYGGNHNNNWIRFTYKDKTYLIYHSSMGFGWRKCAPPSCLQICSNASCDPFNKKSIQEDGCKRKVGGGAPPLSLICVHINADGSTPEFRDPWKEHNGQKALLPCAGDMLP